MSKKTGRTSKGWDEISPWVGLAFGFLYLAAVAAVGVAAWKIQCRDLSSERQSHARHQVRWLSRYLSSLAEETPERLGQVLRQAARPPEIVSCGVVSADGTILAHSEPGRAGIRAAPLTLPGDPNRGVRTAHRAGRADEIVLVTRVASSGGGATGQELRVTLAPVVVSWSQSNLLNWSGYVLLGILTLYLLTYRLFRRSVRPLAAIRERLIRCDNPTAEGLLALRMNDSYDQVSVSWNKLIEFVAECREHVRQDKLTPDITRAMDAYRSERLTNILAEIPFGVLVVDPDETIAFANRWAVRMLGTTGESLDSTPADAVLDEPVRIALLPSEASDGPKAGASSSWLDHKVEREHGDVTLRFWAVQCEGGYGQRILVIQDVTQAKEAEEARDQFLYHVTHELRTPLTNIRAYVETLSEGVVTDEQSTRECYNVIMGETQRLSRLVEDILNVSQLEVGTARMDLGDVQLDRLIRRVVQDTQGNADAKNIDLLLDLPAKMPQVRGDKDRLTVVFTNLIGNAVKYTPQGGRVEVHCTPENGRVKVVVTDTGIGIDPADQDKIFEKFYRVESDEVLAEAGTGLGLAIVKETVRVHGGSITVSSTAGKGSSFIVVLPAVAWDGDDVDGGRISSVEEL